MQKFKIGLILLLTLPVYAVSGAADSNSSGSTFIDGETGKIANLRHKCEIFADSKVIESDEYFFTLGDDIDDMHRDSIYSHPSGARNGPF